MKEHLFRNGFLLTDHALGELPEPVAAVIVGWALYDLGAVQLFADPRLPVATATSGPYMVMLLGTAYDPRHERHDETQIAGALCSCAQASEEKFLTALDDIGGRFVVVLKDPKRVRIFPDACAMKAVFYDLEDGPILVASHAALIATIRGYSRSAFAARLMGRKAYQRRASYFPGLATAYPNVLLLTANTALDALARKVERFFPRMPLAACTRRDDPLVEANHLLRRSIELLRKKAPLALSLTNGIDSRLTLAAAGPDPSTLCFTYLFAKRQVDDARFAQDLCGRFGLEHRLITFDPPLADPKFAAYAAIWRKNTGYVRPDDMAMLSFVYLNAFPKSRLHVKSTISEIGRAFYRNRMPNPGSPTPAAMAALYALGGDDPEVEAAFQTFINTTGFAGFRLFDYDWTDLFYWEHRMSSWQGISMLDHETSHETVIPCNQRAILNALLSLPLEDRLESRGHKRLIEAMWPELAALPYNRSYRMTARALAAARGTLRSIRHYRA